MDISLFGEIPNHNLENVPSKICLILLRADDFLSIATPSSQSKQMQSACNDEILFNFLSSFPGTYLQKQNNLLPRFKS